MKICVLIIFIMMPWISKAGDWALGWTEGNEKLQIAFVMMIFPLIMNALQYYIIDSFIKLKETNHESHANESDDEGRRRRYDDSEDETSRARLVDSEHETDSESDDEDDKPVTRPTHSTQPKSRDSGEYDPERGIMRIFPRKRPRWNGCFVHIGIQCPRFRRLWIVGMEG